MFGPFLIPALRLCPAASCLTRPLLRTAAAGRRWSMFVGFAILLSFSRGAWINAAIGDRDLRLLQLRHRARPTGIASRSLALGVVGLSAIGGAVVVATAVRRASADLLSERAALTQSYDEGPEGRFGGQQKAKRLDPRQSARDRRAAVRTAAHHHEEPHNVYLSDVPQRRLDRRLAVHPEAAPARPPCYGLRHAFGAPRTAAAVPGRLRLLRRQRRSRASSSTSTTGATSTC